jgi:hypothetical protein
MDATDSRDEVSHPHATYPIIPIARVPFERFDEVNLPRLTAIAVLSAALSACSSSTQSLPATGTNASAVTNPAAIAGTMDAWHDSLALNKLPSAGCFKATYPSNQWSRIACGTPPRIWYPIPRSGKPHLGQSVGDGNDFTLDATPNIISSAIGAFPKVKGVTSVVSGGQQDSYTMQLNSNFFTTAQCGTLSNCVGWSQFVYENPPGTEEGALFIQDWLVATTRSGFSNCPPNKGWQNLGIGCVQNSPFGVYLPNINVTQIGSAVLTGDADTSGDSIYITVGKNAYGMKNVQGDGITDLSQHWQGAEFNIIGNGGGDSATFNSGSKISVNIQADDGSKKAPTCPSNSGTTGETNNLFFTKAPKKVTKLKYPSIEFSMTSQSGGTATCNTAKGK